MGYFKIENLKTKMCATITLRSNHMNYSRAILNTNWHQAREAEPKDYDLNLDAQRDLTKSTYSRIGDVTDGSLPLSTYGAFCKSLYNGNNLEMWPKCSNGIEKMMRPVEEKMDLIYYQKPNVSETIYIQDYTNPHPERVSMEYKDTSDTNTNNFKRNISNFTDTDNHRRKGRNTWRD